MLIRCLSHCMYEMVERALHLLRYLVLACLDSSAGADGGRSHGAQLEGRGNGTLADGPELQQKKRTIDPHQRGSVDTCVRVTAAIDVHSNLQQRHGHLLHLSLSVPPTY